MALLPIFIFFLIFQVVSLRLRKYPLLRILMGVLYTYVGLVLFLTGVNVGFSPLGLRAGKRAHLRLEDLAARTAGNADGLVHH